MEGLPKSLLYEMIRYSPKIFFTILSLCKNLQNSVSSDPAYLHYLLEDCFFQDDVRSLRWEESLDLLSGILIRQHKVAYFGHEKLRVYDPTTDNLGKIVFEYPGALRRIPVVNITSKKIFFCGGLLDDRAIKSAHTYDF